MLMSLTNIRKYLYIIGYVRGQRNSDVYNALNGGFVKENIDEPMDTITTNEEYNGMCFPMAELSLLDDMINRPR